MIYVVGDIHGELEIEKLSKEWLASKGVDPNEGDYVVVAGDFGLIWGPEPSDSERRWLDWIDAMPWTTLFVDGNHENFDRLNAYPTERWQGGMVHRVSRKVLHLMRGNVYEICGKKLFAFGGATSHDRALRKEGVSWWPQEMPSEDELAHAEAALANHDNRVDYIVTHCAPTLVQARLS